MLFLLERADGKTFYLKNNREYKVGRKDCDIVINNDASISRKHAVLKITNDKPVIIDCNSKYGTLLQKSKITSDVEHVLNDNDEVEFGSVKNIFRIKYMPIITAGSGLQLPEKNVLKQYITSLNGVLSDNWTSQCTHLTMDTIVLSPKLLLALLDEKPIVNFNFWKTFIENIKNKKPPPIPEEYKPQLGETRLSYINLLPDSRRKTLFVNKLFVFGTESEKIKLNSIIVKAGGECISWEKKPFTLKDLLCSKKEYVIVQNTAKNSEGLETITKMLEKLGKKRITMSEIPLAIVECSTEKNCNPNFDRAKTVFRTENVQVPGEVIAVETQSEYFTASESGGITKPNIVIPETVDPDLGFNSVVHIPNKTKVAIEKTPEESKSTIKRLNEIVSDDLPKKPKLDFLSETEPELVNHEPSLLITEVKSVTKMSPFIATSKRKATDCPIERLPNEERTDPVNPFAKKIKTSDKSLNVTKPMAKNNFKDLFVTQNADKTNCMFSGNTNSPFMRKKSLDEPKEASVFSRATNKTAQNSKSTLVSNNNKTDIRPSTDLTKNIPISYNDTWLLKTEVSINPVEEPTETFVDLAVESDDEVSEKEKYRLELMRKTQEEFCKSFIDKIKINKMNTTVRKLSSTFSGTNNTGKNFKKFKKVQPLRPQTSIISS